jgi:DNA-binding transcriptional regulator YiaG
MHKSDDLTGNDVRNTIELFGLTRLEMATLVGVSLSTVYRWEAHQTQTIKMEPFQRLLIGTVMRQPQSQEKRDQVVTALRMGGVLGGLRILLSIKDR